MKRLVDRDHLYSELRAVFQKRTKYPLPSQEDSAEWTARAHTLASSIATPDLIGYYAYCRQLEAVFKKARGPEAAPPSRLVSKALAELAEIETRNRFYNELLSVTSLANKSHREVLNMAKLIVQQILPPIGMIEDEIWAGCCFGPGSTFATKGRLETHTLSKLGGTQTVTRRCAPLALRVIKTYFPRWGDSKVASLDYVRGNRLAFVPKDKDKCRTIAVEPSLNLFLQQGIGHYLKGRLRRFKIDLRDQSKNRELARKGSIDGSLATIDLSNASSTISRSLVRLLLPPDWYSLLEMVRSPEGRMPDGTWQKYEMFSSQGNAFTFPLETILFFSIVQALHRYRDSDTTVSVYGDDIICESRLAPECYALLDAVGFVVNEKKSFYTGFFRESCGGDFVKGVDVRPIYYKSDCVLFSDVASLHNLLMERWEFSFHNPVLSYLRSCVEKPLHGPRWTIWSDRARPLDGNHLANIYDGWFWCDEHSDVKHRYDPSLQTFVYSWRSWALRPRLPKKYVSSFPDSILALALIKDGSRVLESSPLVTPHVRTVRVTAL